MSWSFTINDLQPDSAIPVETVEYMMTQHIAYVNDMTLALEMGKRAGLKSATFTGCRTPNPYGGDEVVDISVRGHVNATDFNAEIKRILEAGNVDPPRA